MKQLDDNVLSDSQEKIMMFLREFIDVNKFPPTVREICAGVGIKSTSTVHLNLKTLAEKGYIKYTPSTRRAIALLDYNESDNGIMPVPLIGEVAAGMPILALDNIQEYYDLPISMLRGARENEVFMLTVKGDSMIDIGMYDGDVIIVNNAITAQNGDIAVVRISGDSATVKRLYCEKDIVRLQPENKSMQPIYATHDQVEVLGKVIGLIRAI